MSDPASVIRVLLVDDEQMARSAFSASVEAFDDLHLAGACVEGGEACTFVDDNPVDVVLMDLHMPGVNGVEATRTIRKAHPDVRILILTTFDEDEMVDRALTAGASGYLLKSVSPHTLAGAVRAAHGGLQVLAAEPARRRVDSIRAFPSAGIQLTDRERHTLDALLRGMSNAEIATEQYPSQSTVKATVHTLMRKLDAPSRLAVAAARARELGLDRFV